MKGSWPPTASLRVDASLKVAVKGRGKGFGVCRSIDGAALVYLVIASLFYATTFSMASFLGFDTPILVRTKAT
eukprot:11504651-Ditylum_brightwellii.AAC.1